MISADGQPSLLAAWRRNFAAEFVGEHPKVLDLLSSLMRVAAADCDTLVTGASGTGKELVARCIHRASKRRAEPFVAINCAAIPKELMESEIFGHARGAFTGATQRRIGKFEEANGGTLFLDEIGEMEPMLQSKLLRVLQERELSPVGSSQTIKLDIRIVAATNQDLMALCAERLFRTDLYYRLNVVPIHLPALAERKSDIMLLVQHFLRRANERHGRALVAIDKRAQAAIVEHSWPGNVRELHNAIERIAVLKASDGPIEATDLPPHLNSPTLSHREESRAHNDATRGVANAEVARLEGRHHAPIEGHSPLAFGPEPMNFALPAEGVDINDMLARMEVRLTLDALARSAGNKARAADLLGLKRTTLVERLKKLNLSVPA